MKLVVVGYFFFHFSQCLPQGALILRYLVGSSVDQYKQVQHGDPKEEVIYLPLGTPGR